MDPKLSPCQKYALDFLENQEKNVFLTGVAGSGKSFLISEFMKKQDRKAFPLLASTGAAAVLLGGRTFHSFFSLGIMEGGIEKTIERAINDKNLKYRLKRIKGFILDEVSMISGPTLRAAECICRSILDPEKVWGGLRVIVVGDFSQLPPINRQKRTREWAFLDPIWRASQFQALVLRTIMRSEDQEFLEILNSIRLGLIDDQVKDFLARKTDEHFDNPQMTHLFPHRKTAEDFNLLRLQEIENELVEIPTEYTGSLQAIETLKRQAPIPEKLQIKKNALIMLRINDPKQRYVNGSLGIIEEILPDVLIIALKYGGIIELKAQSFSILNAEGEILAQAKNFPINLAYATTIHKSQGMTLDSLVTDLKNLWEPGQAYVALSRLKSSENLVLSSWSKNSFKTDDQVIQFYNCLYKDTLY